MITKIASDFELWYKLASFEPMKANARNVYFRDANLWELVSDAADLKNWSTNQFIEEAVKEKFARIKVRAERTKTGWSAHAIDYPAFTTATDIINLLDNMVESINLYFETTGTGRVIESNEIDITLLWNK